MRGAIRLETSIAAPPSDDHRREQVAVVGLVDAELPLDRLARQPDLAARDPPPGGDTQARSCPLHGVGSRRSCRSPCSAVSGSIGSAAAAATAAASRSASRRPSRSRRTVKNVSASAPYQTIARAMSSPFQITGCQSARGSRSRRRRARSGCRRLEDVDEERLREPVLSRPASKTTPSSANMSAARRIPSGVSTEYPTWCSRPACRHLSAITAMSCTCDVTDIQTPMSVPSGCERPRGGGSRARPRASPACVDVGGGQVDVVEAPDADTGRG